MCCAEIDEKVSLKQMSWTSERRPSYRTMMSTHREGLVHKCTKRTLWLMYAWQKDGIYPFSVWNLFISCSRVWIVIGSGSPYQFVIHVWISASAMFVYHLYLREKIPLHELERPSARRNDGWKNLRAPLGSPLPLPSKPSEAIQTLRLYTTLGKCCV